MRRFKVSGNTYHCKETLKDITPINSKAFWSFDKSGKFWYLTLQDHIATNSFRLLLDAFCKSKGLLLSEISWDGTNKRNNYS